MAYDAELRKKRNREREAAWNDLMKAVEPHWRAYEAATSSLRSAYLKRLQEIDGD